MIAPRTGSKTGDFQIPQELPPGPVRELIPITVERMESLPYFAPISLNWNSTFYQCHLWLERIRTDLEPFIRLPDGQGVAYRHRKVYYLACLPFPIAYIFLKEQPATQQRSSVVLQNPGRQLKTIVRAKTALAPVAHINPAVANKPREVPESMCRS